MRFQALARNAKGAQGSILRQRKRVNPFHRAILVRPKHMLYNQTGACWQYLTREP
jgi:hypothetical protein